MEDKILVDYIAAHGEGKWRNIPRDSGELPDQAHSFCYNFLSTCRVVSILIF